MSVQLMVLFMQRSDHIHVFILTEMSSPPKFLQNNKKMINHQIAYTDYVYISSSIYKEYKIELHVTL